MKKLTLLLLLTAITVNAQDKDNYISFSTGIDLKNAIVGSDPTQGKPAADLIVQFTMVSQNIEVGIGAEIYPRLDYKRYFFGVGYHFPLYAYIDGNELKTTFIPTIEPCMIDRSATWGGAFSDNNNSSHLSISLNLGFQWEVNDYIDIGYSVNFLPRTDLKAKFPANMWSEDLKFADTPISISNFVKITLKLKR